AESGGHFAAARVVVTGTPLRPDLRAGTRADAVARFGLDPALPLIYVTGGAQGAHAINRAVGAIAGDLLTQAQGIHQCGDNRETGDLAWLQTQRAALPPALARRYTVMPWGGAELAGIYAAVSLMISRAGAGTVNEACHLGVPALYVPLPGASGDEPTANARVAPRGRRGRGSAPAGRLPGTPMVPGAAAARRSGTPQGHGRARAGPGHPRCG